MRFFGALNPESVVDRLDVDDIGDASLLGTVFWDFTHRSISGAENSLVGRHWAMHSVQAHARRVYREMERLRTAEHFSLRGGSNRFACMQARVLFWTMQGIRTPVLLHVKEQSSVPGKYVMNQHYFDKPLEPGGVHGRW